MDPKNQLDLRIPIGVLFCTVGVLLVLYGMTATPPATAAGASFSLNIWWGILMVIFGALFLVFARRDAARDRAARP